MAKAKSITVKADEATAFEQLREWAGRADASRFILAVFNKRPLIAGGPNPQKRFVPSRSRAATVEVFFHSVIPNSATMRTAKINARRFTSRHTKVIAASAYDQSPK